MNKAQKVLDKLGGKISGGMHKVLKQTALGRSMEQTLVAMYGFRNDVAATKPAVSNPSVVYDAMRNKGSSHTEAVGKTVLYRAMNGPELNIMLLGVPFLIGATVGTIKVEAKAAKQAKRDEAAKQQAAANKKFAVAPVLGKLAGESLASAPYSANFVQVRQELINCGMRPMVANDLVEGKFYNNPLESWLQEDDLEALMKFLDKYSDLK
ncbi:hypothetical protein [Falsiroseomonas oryziterrae]|uniref:hypothetical protein n=1 Tax=Falsiroseomonas oryziterrae TaxID=2911368 RepID=UPI001F1C4E9B|nr:hypothetical protein [Roseomonas sp. NPKOSM-4]